MLASCVSESDLGRDAREYFIAGRFLVFVYLIVFCLIRIAMELVRSRTRLAVEKGGPRMITLDLRSARRVVRKTLCIGCVCSHIVRGYEPGEELIFCGYAFPPREMLFRVRECTDFRADRVRAVEMTTLEV